MRKILPLFIIILLLSTDYALAEKNEIIQIKLGASYNKITSMLDAPIEEAVTSSFWGNKKALYKLSKGNYCIIEYTLGRVRNVLFLEQVSEEEALEKFHEG